MIWVFLLTIVVALVSFSVLLELREEKSNKKPIRSQKEMQELEDIKRDMRIH